MFPFPKPNAISAINLIQNIVEIHIACSKWNLKFTKEFSKINKKLSARCFISRRKKWFNAVSRNRNRSQFFQNVIMKNPPKLI